MTGFSTFGLSEAMLKKLTSINFTTPTPIQEQSIPHAMAGKDILGTAQTGTGKTAAFGLPLVHHLLNNPHSMALVMTPTRELAVQVMTQIKSFLPEGSTVKAALLIGGEPMFKQLAQLQQKPRVIIGTPGRINDHLERDSLRLTKADFLVLDEADRMLDMGFGVQLEAIAQYLPEQRQTLMFSATVPPNIMKLAKNYLNDPVRVETAAPHLAAPKIKQELVHVNDDTKHDELVKLLGSRSGQIIVFVKTKHGADRLARKLERENHSAEAIHGDLRQGQRDRVIRKFRKNETRILVATDVAARGLDIPMLETVINYDLPQCPEDYIHRIGRTGRNGQEGEAICLITRADTAKWDAIDRLMNPGKAREKSARPEGGKKRSPGGRNYGPKKTFGEKKFGKKIFGEPKRDERNPRAHRAEHPHTVKHARHAEGDFDPVVEQAKVEFDRIKSSGDKPRKFSGDKKFGEKKFSKPFGEKKFGEKKFGDKRASSSSKEGGFKKEWSKDAPKKSWGDKDGNKKSSGSDKPSFNSGKKEWSKDAPKKSFGDKPFNKEGGFKKEGGFGGARKFGGPKSGGGHSAPRRPRSAA